MYGAERLLSDLQSLGYNAEIVIGSDGNKFVVIHNYEVELGRFVGRIIELGIMATPDYPRSVASAIHVKAEPQLFEKADTVPNVRNITNSALGSEWRYWSKNFNWESERTTRRLISQRLIPYLEMREEFSIAIPETVNNILQGHLIRDDYEEDLCFALWNPSEGATRVTALVHTVVLPLDGDRQRHGNASFNQQYFERACRMAMQEKCGLTFLHSHPGTGWQSMSRDDINAEIRLAGATMALTDMPLVGLTVGHDGTWSGRFWTHLKGKEFERRWCNNVRVAGSQLQVSFADLMIPKPAFRELFKRTVTVWGAENHATLARLRIGIVGLGSVGSMVAENLARMGLQQFVLLDFDEVQPHNLDRLVGATTDDIGSLKIDIAEREILRSSTAATVEIRKVPFSIAEETGYEAALDCDVLFSCVDRPRPRHILNHFAYSHLIPVVDGGIAVRFKKGEFSGVDWQLQTVGLTRPCLFCLGVFNMGDVSTEIEGKLDDPSYLQGLSNEHRFKRNENVFPFSANLASLEILQLVALVTNIAGIADFGIQRFRYNPGILDADSERTCKKDCEFVELIAQGDKHFSLFGRDLGAEKARERQSKHNTRYEV